MTVALLLCTVGSSPEPVISALRALRPRRVYFLATEDRPELAQRGSADQVPLILAAAGEPPGGHELLVVPPDDPDAVFAAASALLERAGPGPVAVDYTGGTKSMSAGLLQAALGRPGVAVQIMAGERSATDQVRAGTERPFRLRFDATLAARDLERAAAFWRAFAYGAAAGVLAPWLAEDEGRVDDLPAPLAARLRRVHALSEAFDAWDRFDHGAALRLLEKLPGGAPDELLPALRRLAANAGRTERRGTRERWLPPEDPLIPLDLWRNAERRAAQRRFDDAVARCYRLTEATVQWVLWSEKGIDTGAVDRARVHRDTAERLTERNELSLIAAYSVLGNELGRTHPFYRLMKGPFGDGTVRTGLDGWIRVRNDSILAHGFRPIAAEDWGKIAKWCQHALVPWLEAETRKQGLTLPQLPRKPPVG